LRRTSDFLLDQAHHEFDDAFLGQGVVAALLADIDALGVLGNLAQHIVGHQVVVEHHARWPARGRP
jgi:predicted DNA repair protein MutK